MWSTMFVLLQATTISCITFVKEKGLLTVQEKNIFLSTMEGEKYRMHAGTDQQYMQYLSGCILSAEGFSLWHHFYVDSWSIQDAGSGSAPFFGALERQGIQWMMRDHNSNSLIILDGIDEFIRPQAKRIVLIGGYVVGPQRIKVVSARFLDGAK